MEQAHASESDRVKTRAMLISSSLSGHGGFLEHAREAIQSNGFGGRRAVFIPYARVDQDYEYGLKRAANFFSSMNITLESVSDFADKPAALRDAGLILVGGGNTFALLEKLYRYDLVHVIKRLVTQGTPYIGWSAGANIAAPTIKTVNSMPIVEVPSFSSLGIVPFQVNCHYTNEIPPGHTGESRSDRISEFTLLYPSIPVVALRESEMMMVAGKEISIYGSPCIEVFMGGKSSSCLDPLVLRDLINWPSEPSF